jgi:hypothetical protein
MVWGLELARSLAWQMALQAAVRSKVLQELLAAAFGTPRD